MVEQMVPDWTVRRAEYLQLLEDLPGELGGTNSAGGDQPVIANRQRVDVPARPGVLRHHPLEVRQLVARMGPVIQQPGPRKRQGATADSSDRHSPPPQVMKQRL